MDIDRLFADADPARDVAIPGPDSPAARQAFTRITQTAAPAPRAGQRRRRRALTGGLAVSLSAGVAVTLALVATGATGPPGKNPETGVTAASVLDNAALAALREPAHRPRPDQFVYYKTYQVYREQGFRLHGGRKIPAHGGVETDENWLSVGGTRQSLFLKHVNNGSGPKIDRSYWDWCAHGVEHPPPTVLHWVKGKRVEKQVTRHCNARDFAYRSPDLPSTTAGARAFFRRQLRLPTYDINLFDGHGPYYLLLGSFHILTQYYLTPAQQAAMFHGLATIPGLTVIPKVTNVLGRVGVGIHYQTAAYHTAITVIFDPATFKLIGADENLSSSHTRTALVTPPTIVSNVGQRP